MPEISEQKQNHQRLQQVNKALGSGMFVHVRKLLQNMPAYDIALILESSHPKSRAVLWQLIDADNHGEVLEELNEEVRKGILKNIRPEKLAEVAEGMDVDDVASNWGNWQYLAGVGADPRGHRRFDLAKQTQTYDPKQLFIKHWGADKNAPPLDSVDAADWPIVSP